MSRSGAAPVWEQLAIGILGPPIMAFLWWLTSKGNASSLGTDDNPAVQGWISDGWKYVLGICYAVVILMFIYAYFIKA
jgi:hypothetical protein